MLAGKYAVITGAAKGIGACAVKRFLDENIAGVALVDMNLEAAQATAKELDPTGLRAFAFQCNVANFDDTTRCFNEILEKFGRVLQYSRSSKTIASMLATIICFAIVYLLMKYSYFTIYFITNFSESQHK